LKNFFGFWDGMVDFFSGAIPVVVIAGCLLLILAVMFFSVFKLRIISSTLAILTSTVVCCLLMIPAISAFNHLAGSKTKGAEIDRVKNEIAELKFKKKQVESEYRMKELELEKAKNDIKIGEQTVELAALKDQIATLQHAQLSVQSFDRILELALLQTNIQQSLVRLERIGEPKKCQIIDWGCDYYIDEALVVINHDIDAKYGVNLNEIKISKIDDNTAVVTGIRPKFIGASKNKSDFLIQEIWRRKWKNDVLSTTDILNGNTEKERARRYAKEYENEFQQKLSEGMEFAFMDTAVIQLSQNFIKVMLAPLYKNIIFDNAHRSNSLPIMEHLRKELTDVNVRMNKLSNDRQNRKLGNENIGTSVEEINKELSKLKKEKNFD